MRLYTVRRKRKLKKGEGYCTKCRSVHKLDHEHEKHLVDFIPGVRSISVGTHDFRPDPHVHTYKHVVELVAVRLAETGEFEIELEAQ